MQADNENVILTRTKVPNDEKLHLTDDRRKREVCVICGVSGHWGNECPYKRHCTICQSYMHSTERCPRAKVDTEKGGEKELKVKAARKKEEEIPYEDSGEESEWEEEGNQY